VHYVRTAAGGSECTFETLQPTRSSEPFDVANLFHTETLRIAQEAEVPGPASRHDEFRGLLRQRSFALPLQTAAEAAKKRAEVRRYRGGSSGVVCCRH
jgi:hypothetical protein